MCGINGIYGLEKISDGRALIEKMNQSIAHRGPDASGVYQGENVILGHRRLSILDLSSHANQPFNSKDGRFSLVYNGEIYNYLELRNQLKDSFQFQTNSDTEVLLAAYMNWGAACLQKLNGMFAFAIWDALEEKLFLARDRVGIKPLYFAYHNGAFVFSSEVRAILNSELIPRKLSSSSLLDYLHYQTVHAPNTIVEGISLLEAGCYIEVSDEGFTKSKYWSLTSKSQLRINVNEAHNLIREKFQSAVKRRLMADVPFGAFLSGGIDSSLIVSQMAESMDRPVETFTVSFDESQFSEAKYAKIVSDKFQTNHTEIKLRPTDLLEILPDALAAIDHPSGDGANTFLISKVTKNAGISMVLSGLGGDELFAGYPVFRQLAELSQKKWILSFPKALRSLAGQALMNWHKDIASLKKAELLASDYFELPYAYPISRKLISEGQFKKYFKNNNRQFINPVFDLLSDEIAYGKEGFHLPFLSKISVAEMQTYMQHTLLRDTDQMSMNHALEVRVPFLDHELIELVLQLPDSLKLKHASKALLQESFPGVLPKEITNRPKMGFSFPWEIWMRNELKDFVKEHMHSLNERNIFKKDGVANFYRDFEKGSKFVTWSRIWHLVVLENYIYKQKLTL